MVIVDLIPDYRKLPEGTSALSNNFFVQKTIIYPPLLEGRELEKAIHKAIEEVFKNLH